MTCVFPPWLKKIQVFCGRLFFWLLELTKCLFNQMSLELFIRLFTSGESAAAGYCILTALYVLSLVQTLLIALNSQCTCICARLNLLWFSFVCYFYIREQFMISVRFTVVKRLHSWVTVCVCTDEFVGQIIQMAVLRLAALHFKLPPQRERADGGRSGRLLRRRGRRRTKKTFLDWWWSCTAFWRLSPYPTSSAAFEV